jgi:hypothetical protein
MIDNTSTRTSSALFWSRVLHHQQRRKAGDDPADVDVAIIIETRKLLQARGIPLPSDECVRDLIDMLDGRPSSYLRRKQNQRPKLTRQQILIGNATHFVETLIVGDTFSVKEATVKVADKLDTAGLRETAKGKTFKSSTIDRWHQYVMHHAKRGVDPAWDVFEMQQRVLKRLHPDYMQWGEGRLLEWLADEARKMAQLRFFARADFF